MAELLCSVRRGAVLVYNWVFVDVTSVASQSEVMSYDELSVTQVSVLRPRTSAVIATVNLPGSSHAGAR